MTISKSDKLQAFYSEAYFGESLTDNSGETCFKIVLEYDNEETEEKTIAESVCVGAKNKEGTTLPELSQTFNGV